MLDNLTPQTTLLIFRLSVSLLIGSVNLLSCFLGKLLKERSILNYSLFHTFCAGILLAKGFADLFLQREIRTEIAAVLFSSTFLLLYVVKTCFVPSIYEYSRIANTEVDMNDDEDLGIEISDNVPPYLQEDEETGGYSGGNAELEQIQSRKLSIFWFVSVIGAVMLNEISKGIVLGSEEHASLSSYGIVMFDGLLQSLAFGVVCEESLSSSSSYLGSVMLFVASKPFGVLVGNFTTHSTVEAAYSWMMIITSGVYLAFTVFYMLPADEKLAQSNAAILTAAKQPDRRSPKMIRSFVFLVGYLVAFIFQFL